MTHYYFVLPQIFYALGFDGLNGILHTSPESEMKISILTALKYLKSRGCEVERASMSDFKNSLEISLGSLVLLEDFPYLINTSNPNKLKEFLSEMGKAILGKSKYTIDALYLESIRRFNATMRTENILKYKAEVEVLKTKFAVSILITSNIALLKILIIFFSFRKSSAIMAFSFSLHFQYLQFIIILR